MRARMKLGFCPQASLETKLKDDLGRNTGQVIIIDKNGRTAAFTGKGTTPWKGHIVGENFVIAGNILVSGHVLEAMRDNYENSRGELAERILKTLEAEAGGDKGRTFQQHPLWLLAKKKHHSLSLICELTFLQIL